MPQAEPIIVERTARWGHETMRGFRIDVLTGHNNADLVQLKGVRKNGSILKTHWIEFHADDIDTLIYALNLAKAGPLGKLALAAEREGVKTNV